MLGFSKGGLAGVGSLALPLMALVIDPVQAAAILLPILIAQDIVGVWSFRRHLDWYVLGWTLPGATIGILIGYLFAARVSAAGVMALLGVISIAFGAYRLWLGRRGAPKTTGTPSPGWVGSLAGVASGFTSQIAHAGAPPFQLWVLPRRLPRDVLVGTWAVYFAALNWIKVPAFAALGQFTANQHADGRGASSSCDRVDVCGRLARAPHRRRTFLQDHLLADDLGRRHFDR